MTAEQVQASETMQLKPEDTQALMEKYGIQMPQFGNDGSRPTVSADERATRRAQFQSQGGGTQGGGQGNFPGGGQGGFTGGGQGQPPAGGFEGGFPGGGAVSGTPNAQGTPQPRGGFRGGGMFNNLFVDPLIKLLEERANS
jgi:hypothetical protein